MNLTQEEAVRLAVEQAPRLAEMRAREAAASSVGDGAQGARPAHGAGQHAVPSAQPHRGTAVAGFWQRRRDDGVLSGSSRTSTGRARKCPSRSTASAASQSNVAAANADVTAAQADLRVVEADVRLDVLRAYWSLATARDSARVLVQSLARTDAWVGDVKARVDTGLLPPNDVLSAQAQRARQQVRLLQAQNDEAMAELDLARLIGVPPGTPIRTTSAVDCGAAAGVGIWPRRPPQHWSSARSAFARKPRASPRAAKDCASPPRPRWPI